MKTSEGTFAFSSVTIDVYSDVICPWCFIGKRRLEAAVRELGLENTVVLRWHPFELNPDMLEEGMDRATYRALKFGAEKSRLLDEQVAEVGRSCGIAFDYAKVARIPNTRRAHRLLSAAPDIKTQNDLAERLFSAYFEKGDDVGDPKVLARLAVVAGMAEAAIRTVLADTNIDRKMQKELDEAQKKGIQGVPFFIVNESDVTLSGGQPSDIWKHTLSRFMVLAVGR
jgi:predicted DsbA family dithiol-disulfide isomerase